MAEKSSFAEQLNGKGTGIWEPESVGSNPSSAADSFESNGSFMYVAQIIFHWLGGFGSPSKERICFWNFLIEFCLCGVRGRSHQTENLEGVGSIPTGGTTCGGGREADCGALLRR